MILVELTAAIDAAGTLKQFYVSTDWFVTEAGDTPPNTAFLQCISDPGSIGLHAFSDGRTGGATKLETGEITLINSDGRLDDWARYSFDGRPVVVRTGSGGAYPGAFANLMVATVEGVDCTFDKVVIRIKDKQFVFDKPVLTKLYGGTNVLPTGLDGVPTDLKGKARPAAFGTVFNVSPPMVNTSRLIYEVGVCKSVDHVYSNGAELTAGAAYTSQADMEANSPAAGNFRVWPAGGYFRIGSYSAEQITADITQGDAAADRTAGQILLNLARASGLGAAELAASDAAALDLLNPAVVGIWLDDATTTFASAMDQVAASVGAWYGFDATGVLRMGRLAAPSGPAKFTLAAYQILDGLERRTPTDNGIPICSVTVSHSKNYTVQSSGLAGSAAARQGFVNEEFRTSNATDATVKNQWLLAGTLEVSTVLTTTAAGDAEAARLLAIHKIRRDLFEVPIDQSVFAASKLWLIDTLAIDYPRFQLNTGRVFEVIGIAFELSTNKVVLTIWG